MPRHALGLKKYLPGAFASRMVDKEHATASLGDSEMLRVEYAPLKGPEGSKGNTSVGPTVGGTPNFSSHQERENGCEVVSVVAAERSGYVLPNNDPWVFSMCRLLHSADVVHGRREKAGSLPG